jgi:hypothetical protein
MQGGGGRGVGQIDRMLLARELMTGLVKLPRWTCWKLRRSQGLRRRGSVCSCLPGSWVLVLLRFSLFVYPCISCNTVRGDR